MALGISIAGKTLAEWQVGQTARVVPVSRPDLQIGTDLPVFRLPFRSNAQYYTHDMWRDNATLVFETVLNPDSTGFPHDRCWSMLWQGTFTDNGMEVKLLTDPAEPAQFLQEVLAPNKQALFYVTKTDIVELDLETLQSRVLVSFKDTGITQAVAGMTLTCDQQFLIFGTWKSSFEERPNGCIYSFDRHNKLLKQIDEFVYPQQKTHFLASPTNPRLMSYAMTGEIPRYPAVKEIPERLWLMDLDTLQSRGLYKSQRRGIFRRFETLTHECWGRDGTYLTLIARRNQIRKIDVATGQANVIMDDGPNPWHCDGANGQYFVFDTMHEDTGIWVGKFGARQLVNLCETRANARHQSYHPHPFFSPNLDKVIFNSLDGIEGYLHVVKTDLKK